MSRTGYGTIALPLTFLLFGCATDREQAPSIPARAAPVTVDDRSLGEVTPVAAGLGRALSEAVDDRSSWDSLHLKVECVGDAGMRSVEVYGNGVGIWDYRRQFTLTAVEVSSLLRTLGEADFASFADVYGGSKPADPRPREEGKKPGVGSALRVICRVALSLAGQTKEVTQVSKGEQSAQLKQLADDLLAVCETPGQTGTAVADLSEGLEMVSSGRLVPETFRVLLYRKPEAAGAEADGVGYLLRLSGTRVTSRGYPAQASLFAPASLTLSPSEVAGLARELASANLAQLPINLYAPDYKDLTVEVLNHKKSVQARQFAGMTPATHAERQLEFDRIYDALNQLHLRVQRDGEPESR